MPMPMPMLSVGFVDNRFRARYVVRICPLRFRLLPVHNALGDLPAPSVSRSTAISVRDVATIVTMPPPNICWRHQKRFAGTALSANRI
jgi:hypothetical protein